MNGGTIFGRQPIAITSAFAAVLNVVIILWNSIKPAGSPEITTEMAAAINVAFVAIIAVVANAAVTPIGDARLNNGTQVNSGQSVVVPLNTLNGQRAANVITPVSPYNPS